MARTEEVQEWTSDLSWNISSETDPTNSPMSELVICIIALSSVFGLLGLMYLGMWFVCRYFDKIHEDLENVYKDDEGD